MVKPTIIHVARAAIQRNQRDGTDEPTLANHNLRSDRNNMMTTYTIEKNIPLPAKQFRLRATLDAMQVGDSFLVPASEVGSEPGLRASVSWYGKKKMAVRKTTAGMRIWKIAA